MPPTKCWSPPQASLLDYSVDPLPLTHTHTPRAVAATTTTKSRQTPTTVTSYVLNASCVFVSLQCWQHPGSIPALPANTWGLSGKLLGLSEVPWPLQWWSRIKDKICPGPGMWQPIGNTGAINAPPSRRACWKRKLEQVPLLRENHSSPPCIRGTLWETSPFEGGSLVSSLHCPRLLKRRGLFKGWWLSPFSKDSDQFFLVV